MKKWAMYRPSGAKFLTIPTDLVKMMAVSDHSFGCDKLQFCTFENTRSSRIGSK